jgi:hypothetical protein
MRLSLSPEHQTTMGDTYTPVDDNLFKKQQASCLEQLHDECVNLYLDMLIFTAPLGMVDADNAVRES